MKVSIVEMEGLLRGKCVPAKMRVNESLSAYLVRQFDALHERAEAAERELDELRAGHDTLQRAVDNLDAERDALRAELARRDAAAGEPVGVAVEWKHPTEERRVDFRWIRYVPAGTKLYTAAPPAVLPPGDYSELLRLREDVKGPDGFDTWKDAAIAERVARVALERGAVNSNHEIDYLTAMSAFHSDQWHKMSPITGYMHGYNRASSQIAPSAVVSDEVLREVIRIWQRSDCPSPEVYSQMREALGAQPPKPVVLPEPHAHLIWIKAGRGPDDYWDDVEVSRSDKDRCCDGSERYAVYSEFEVKAMLNAANIPYEVKP